METRRRAAVNKMLRRVLLALVAGAAALSAPKARAPIKVAPAVAAAAAALAPAAALADVSFVEEVEGVALGLLPLAGIAAIVGGGAIAKLGPSLLEKAAKMKRTLALSTRRSALKKDMDVGLRVSCFEKTHGVRGKGGVRSPPPPARLEPQSMESEPALMGVRMGAAGGVSAGAAVGARGGVAGGVEAIVPSADIWTEAISTGGGMASSSSSLHALVTASRRSKYHK